MREGERLCKDNLTIIPISKTKKRDAKQRDRSESSPSLDLASKAVTCMGKASRGPVLN